MINDNESKTEMKSRSQRYDIIWPRPRHWHKYTKFKMCPNIMMVTYIKNIWSSIHEKVKQHRGWVEKKALLLKKACSQGALHFDLKEYQQETSKDYKGIMLYLCSVEDRDFVNYMEVPSLPGHA